MDFFLRSHSFFDSAMPLSISREICSAARRSCSRCFRSSSLSSGGGWSALDSGSWVSAFEEMLVRGLLDRILVRLGMNAHERGGERLSWVVVVEEEHKSRAGQLIYALVRSPLVRRYSISGQPSPGIRRPSFQSEMDIRTQTLRHAFRQTVPRVVHRLGVDDTKCPRSSIATRITGLFQLSLTSRYHDA